MSAVRSPPAKLPAKSQLLRLCGRLHKRNNWLFTGSERGGRAAAIVYTLIESCRRVNVDPYVYLRDVLVRVATHPASRVDELTPDRWKMLFGPQSAA